MQTLKDVNGGKLTSLSLSCVNASWDCESSSEQSTKSAGIDT